MIQLVQYFFQEKLSSLDSPLNYADYGKNVFFYDSLAMHLVVT